MGQVVKGEGGAGAGGLPQAGTANKMKHGGHLAHVPEPVTRRGRATRPEVIAHRGANREARENTLGAFELALEARADGIELDIQLSREGTPVVHHDPALPAPAPDGPRVPLNSVGSSELRRQSIPTLDEVLELVAGRCRLYVEIKDGRAVEAVVRRLSGFESWCAVHSFDHRVSRRARELNPALPSGILLVSRLVDTAAALRAAGARDVWQHAELIDRDLVTEVHDANGRVIAWTVNDETACRQLIGLGVDGICTDLPRALSPLAELPPPAP